MVVPRDPQSQPGGKQPPAAGTKAGATTKTGEPNVVATVGVQNPSSKRPGREPLGGMGPRYFTYVDTPYGKVKAFPRYYSGDEWKIGGWSFEKRYAVAQQLVELGLLDPKKATGAPNSALREAYANLLRTSNATGVSWKQFLDRELAKVRSLPPEQRPSYAAATDKQPKIIKLTNPEDIGATLVNVAKQLYSGGLSPEQVASFVQRYQDLEREAQEENYSMMYGPEGTGVGAGGTLVQPPDLAVMAEKELRTQNPEQVFTSAFGQLVGQIMPGLGRPGGGAL